MNFLRILAILAMVFLGLMLVPMFFKPIDYTREMEGAALGVKIGPSGIYVAQGRDVVRVGDAQGVVIRAIGCVTVVSPSVKETICDSETQLPEGFYYVRENPAGATFEEFYKTGFSAVPFALMIGLVLLVYFAYSAKR